MLPHQGYSRLENPKRHGFDSSIKLSILQNYGIMNLQNHGLSDTEARHPQLLLDGQQRLTSLAAIMLGRDLRVRDAPKPIDIAFNVYTEKFEVAGPGNVVKLAGFRWSNSLPEALHQRLSISNSIIVH